MPELVRVGYYTDNHLIFFRNYMFLLLLHQPKEGSAQGFVVMSILYSGTVKQFPATFFVSIYVLFLFPENCPADKAQREACASALPDV
jgi:hypothetical protein